MTRSTYEDCSQESASRLWLAQLLTAQLPQEGYLLQLSKYP